MTNIATVQINLPTTIEDLSKFALIGREKLVAVRAEIRAIDKVGLAQEVREQKLLEAQEIADAVLDAEVKIGELMAAIPKKSNNNPTGKNQYGGGQSDTAVVLTKTKADVIKETGFTQKQVQRFQTMAAHPEAVERAKADARENNDIVSRAAVFDKIRTQKRDEKKQAVKQRIDEYAAVQTGTIDIATTDKKYNIIYADPPWRYWEGGDKNQSLHYTTMTIDEICDLPVRNIADDDCVLFLWVTYPILNEAFRVIESWGFKYSTAAFVWVKKNKHQDTPFFGNGAWTRANTELCLLATKGSITRLDATISQVVESPIEEHSKKPDIVRDLITRLVGELPRVELFCRNPADGWDVWGNEA